MKNSRWALAVPTFCALALFLAGCQPREKMNVSFDPDAKKEKTDVVRESGPSDGLVAATSEPTATGTTTTTPPPTDPSTPTSNQVARPDTVSKVTDAPVAPSTPVSTGGVTLKLVMESGKEISFRSNSESTQKFKGDEKNMPKPTTSKSETDLKLKVLEVKDGKTKVEMMIAKVKSDAGDAAMQAQVDQATKKMEGASVVSTYDARGNALNQEVTKGSMSDIVAAGLSSNTGFFGLTYPESAVKAGDTWSGVMNFPKMLQAMMPMQGATFEKGDVPIKFTLNSYDSAKGTANITFKLSGRPVMIMKMPAMKDKEGKTISEAREMRTTFVIDTTGNATVDAKSGIPSKIDYQGQIDVQGLMGMSLTQTIKSTLVRK
ncbi:MAG: hypothetical protein KIT11_00605 [Fimbriimonadaceae bacterium]|nr:hypothetical protein [Fimbriimonadaceae bacterium]QYK55127.1 MAG: hypothetical protein KF733_08930 [Fimbriimonadaceae bacterium]